MEAWDGYGVRVHGRHGTGRPDKIDALWGPVERYTLSEKADASSKARGLLPDEAIQMDIWQYAPAELPQLRAMRGRDLLFQAPGRTAAPNQPPAPAPAPGVQPVAPPPAPNVPGQ